MILFVNVHRSCWPSVRLRHSLLYNLPSFYALAPDSVGEDLCFRFVCLSVCLFIHLSGQILLPRYLMYGLSSLDETFREYSVASTDNLIRFWRPKVKVTAGH